MRKLFLNQKICKKIATLLLSFLMLLSSALPYLQMPFSPKPAFAACSASSTSTSGTNSPRRTSAKLSGRVGGVALDQAAKFLADMSEVTGAYYDQDLDRIVFVGRKSATLPKFDRDDLAVAIKAIMFHGEIPWVSLEGTNPDPNYVDAVFSPGIENTRFGEILIQADYKLKQYAHGYDTNDQLLVSSVPGYKSFHDRYYEKIQSHDPTGYDDLSRFWITPQLISLKKDDVASAFVFETVKMQVQTEAMGNNSPYWTAAADEFADHFTQYYDSFGQESPIINDTKRLGQIAAVVKWINDSGITTDFYWARDYAPKKVTTAKSFKKIYSKRYEYQYEENGQIFDASFRIEGGADLFTDNTYSQDSTGTSSGLKDSSQQVQTTKEDVHWTFNKDGQSYEAVAVAADAFRTLGSYTMTATDMAFPTAGDLSLAFQRTYSSFSGGQYGVGRGWNIYPALLFDNKPAYPAITLPCANGNHPKSLAFVSQTGGFESFTINDCSIGYVADDPAYHSQVFHNTDGTFTVRLKNQTEFIFSSEFKLTKVKDKVGNVMTYAYDGSGKIANIADGKGHQLTVNYGSNDLISSISDWSGRAVSYTYDAEGNLLTVKDPNNNTTSYAYDTNFKLTKVTDRNSQAIVTNTYTDEAKLTTQKDTTNTTNTYTYDKVNRKITSTDNNGRTQVTTYDNKARVLEVKDPLNFTLKYTYGSEYSPLTATDKNGNKITNTYDAKGNLASIIYPDNKKVTFTYDSKNRLTKEVDERYTTPKTTNYTYDALGNLTQVDEAGRITRFTYDTTGEMLSSTDPLSRLIKWTRDNFGNKLTEIDPLNNTTTFAYDTIAQLTTLKDAELKQITYTYDANGNVLTTKDAIGITTNTYDKENRLTKITYPNLSVTNFSYNTSGSLTNVTDASTNVTTYGYDSYQNLTTQQDALNRQTINTYDNINRLKQSSTPLAKVYKWEYDANGNITKRIDANNNATTYTYDVLNRLTKIAYPDTKTVSYEYDARGNMTKMIDPVGTSIYEYDQFNRMTKATNAYGKVISYQYDSVGNLTKLIYPDNNSVSYIYDVNNNLKTVTDLGGKQTQYTYYKNGLVATRQYPNGIKTTYTYDAANRLSQITHTQSYYTRAKFVYTRDLLGNITKVDESGSWISSTVQPTTFTYDAIGRLTKAVYPGSKTYTYTYDKVGNRLTEVDPSDSFAFTYDSDDKLTLKDRSYNDISYQYDSNGNLVWKTSTNANPPHPEYNYDFENRLTRHLTQAGNEHLYTYDGNGNRLKHYFSTAVTEYTYDTSGSMSRLLEDGVDYYLYGNGVLGSGDPSFGTSHYYIEDGIGNVRFSTSSSGGTWSKMKYDPFGNDRSSFGSELFQFHGQQYDSASNLYYMRARYYDPELGRFISRDPVKGDLNNPQSLHPYVYSFNNPVNFSDPSGEYIDTAIDVAFLAYDLCQGNWGWAAVDVGMMLLPVANTAIVRGGAKAVQTAKQASRMEKLQEAAKVGREVHQAMEYPAGFVKEKRLESGLRPDALNYATKQIIELKPNNPAAIKRGERQLEKYINELNLTDGPGWTGNIWTY